MGLRTGSYTSVTSYQGGGTNTSSPLNHTSDAIAKQDFYTLGKLIKDYVLDPIANKWRGKSSETSNPVDNTEKFERKFVIYRTGLKECARNLESAVDNLDIKKIKQVVEKCSSYLQPYDDGELLNLQKNVLRPLKMRIRRIANSHFKKEVQELLPILFPKLETDANAKLFLESASSMQKKRSQQQSQGFPTNLTNFDGVVVNGVTSYGKFGNDVAELGDVNNDGYDDIAISVASAFVVNIYFGGPNRSLSGLTPNVTISGLTTVELFGWSLCPAGDMNGDGFDDFVIGAPGFLNATGVANFFFGQKDWPLQMTSAILNGTNGFTMQGLAPRDYLGYSACTSGDVNGDGLGDVVVGAYAASPGGIVNAGAAYVIFGKQGVWPPLLTPASLNGTLGLALNGNVQGGGLGFSVCPAGDINGDGLDDLVVGVPLIAGLDAAVEGAAFVYFGQRGVWPSSMSPAILNGTNGFAALGKVPYNTTGGRFGYSACTAGDTNGDGFDDLVIGAPYQPSTSNQYPLNAPAGAFYVISGHSGAWAPVFNFTALNGKNGFAAYAFAPLQFLGYSVRAAGDINGDGLDDLLVGAPQGGFKGGGTEIVLLGQKNGWTPEVDLSMLNATTGFRIDGLAFGDYLGASGGTAGNFLGNSYYPAVMLGAPGLLQSNGTVYIAANLRPPAPTSGSHSNEGSNSANKPVLGAIMAVFIARILKQVGELPLLSGF